MTVVRSPSAPARASRVVLAVSCACTALVVGLVAAVNLATPKLAASALHPTSAQLLWIVDSYVLVFAGLVIAGGATGDRLGRKGVLLTGLGVFAAGAALSAGSSDVAVMLIGRAVAGVGAALALPNTLAVLIHSTPAQRRARAIAVWASMTGLGGVAGNVGGGLALSSGSWRVLFVAAAVLGGATLAWAAVVIPRSARNHRHIHPIGAAALTLADFALLVGIIEGPEHGWTSALVLGAFVASTALFAVWQLAELRVAEPLLDPRLLRVALLRTSCLGMLVAFFGMFALFYVNASFLQFGKGYSVLTTGCAIVPMTVPMLLLAPRIPALADRFGARALLAVAFAAIGGGLLGLSTCGQRTPYVGYAAWLVLVGFGCAIALPLLSADITRALPADHAGVGSGLQATTRELGSALGVAVIGTVLNARFRSLVPRATGDSVSRALAAAHGPAAHDMVVHAYVNAADLGWRAVGVVTLVLGALVTARAVGSRR